MTCIAGMVDDEDSVWIGGDSAGIADHEVTIRSDQKVFRSGEFLYGFTASYRMGQLLQYRFQPPAHDPGVDTFTYLVTTWIDAVQDCFRANRFREGGTFLLGYRGRLFRIESDFQVAESRDGYDAVGSGAAYALGSMYGNDDDPAHVIRVALEAAAHHCRDVRPPFVIARVTMPCHDTACMQPES